MGNIFKVDQMSTIEEENRDGTWQSDEEEQTLSNPDEEILQISKADLIAIMKKAREKPSLLNCAQCKAN